MNRHLALLCVLAMGCLPGCAWVERGGRAVEAANLIPAATADESTIAALKELQYPAGAPLGDDLDIIVIGKSKSLRLANRTPETYEDVQVWINRQYVRPVRRIDIGTDNTLSLGQFVNHYGETFPLGGVLSPDKAFPVVLAEVFNPATGRRHRMTVYYDKRFRGGQIGAGTTGSGLY